MRPTTRLLLAGGAIAGPLFTAAWIVEGATRADYDPMRHPVSALAISEFGWSQAANFMITGLLLLGFAVGLRRSLRPEGMSMWAPRFVAAAAIGLIGAGVFVTDPMNGYPPGTSLVPLQYSVAGRLHRLFSVLFFLGIPLAAFNLGRWFDRSGNRSWAIYSAVSALSFMVFFLLASAGFFQVGSLSTASGLFQRTSLTIGWGWITVLALRVAQGPMRVSRIQDRVAKRRR